MAQPIISVSQLEKVYHDNGIPVMALRDVTLTITEGEFSVIAGPSGSGKTTLLNIIGALDTPTRGTVLLNGESLANKTKKQLADLRLNKIGFIFQAYNLNPVLSSFENIELTMMLRGVAPEERKLRAYEVMRELGIEELADKRPNQMSGGQQQRVAVARAIVNNPTIVLADEPTANLDSATGAKLLDLMQQMNAEKKITFVFSSHDHQVIARAKRLIYLRDGMVIQDTLQS